ncbi:hypothetical protein PV04_00548 [Phialophora macrospora]|uniref:Uncharacterized protein n=1 Tax=Phialophora macrospora TaxID=1851006 RepID=A0A0D2GJ06_9EURO|nr:hypothetical protein PV04_00548 [Phialophora macrospora]
MGCGNYGLTVDQWEASRKSRPRRPGKSSRILTPRGGGGEESLRAVLTVTVTAALIAFRTCGGCILVWMADVHRNRVLAVVTISVTGSSSQGEKGIYGCRHTVRLLFLELRWTRSKFRQHLYPTATALCAREYHDCHALGGGSEAAGGPADLWSIFH